MRSTHFPRGLVYRRLPEHTRANALMGHARCGAFQLPCASVLLYTHIRPTNSPRLAYQQSLQSLRPSSSMLVYLTSQPHRKRWRERKSVVSSWEISCGSPSLALLICCPPDWRWGSSPAPITLTCLRHTTVFAIDIAPSLVLQPSTVRL